MNHPRGKARAKFGLFDDNRESRIGRDFCGRRKPGAGRRFQRPVINRRRLPRDAIMIHRIRPIRPNLHLEHSISPAPADPFDRNPNIGQVLSKAMVIDRKVTLTGSMNWAAGAARNSDDINLVASEAVAAAYMAHWQNRQAVSAAFTRREDWCRRPEVADLKPVSPPR